MTSANVNDPFHSYTFRDISGAKITLKSSNFLKAWNCLGELMSMPARSLWASGVELVKVDGKQPFADQEVFKGGSCEKI